MIQITRIDLHGLKHARAGDLQAVLFDPSGNGHNLFVRSGFTGAGLGNTGKIDGNVALVTSGQTPFPGATNNIGSGLYNQDFGTTGAPPAPWNAGDHGIFNTPISSIPAALAGTWKLVIFDWAADGTGTLTGWTLSGTDNQAPISAFCLGDGTQQVACPCGNSGATGRGCANSVASSGALLSATGSASDDTVVLTSSGEPATSLSIVLQAGNTLTSTALFGDGLLCLAGNLKRLYVRNAVGGAVTVPAPGDPSIQTRSAQLGDSIPLGGIRHYQVYYRDPSATFCPTGGTFNISNALRIVWI
jgi:hypothetical protein